MPTYVRSSPFGASSFLLMSTSSIMIGTTSSEPSTFPTSPSGLLSFRSSLSTSRRKRMRLSRSLTSGTNTVRRDWMASYTAPSPSFTTLPTRKECSGGATVVTVTVSSPSSSLLSSSNTAKCTLDCSSSSPSLFENLNSRRWLKVGSSVSYTVREVSVSPPYVTFTYASQPLCMSSSLRYRSKPALSMTGSADASMSSTSNTISFTDTYRFTPTLNVPFTAPFFFISLSSPPSPSPPALCTIAHTFSTSSAVALPSPRGGRSSGMSSNSPM
mmetsp:Transcript_16110/g.40743  ORF Transcript_16110/g.40743 Transcript_16110/m.40743 type:complete len:271 (-) Transcript_16110:292-1104(-)